MGTRNGFRTPWIIALVAGLIGTGTGTGETIAYWRFEEGLAGDDIRAAFNSVIDHSGHGNHLRPFFPVHAPAYMTDTPFDYLPGSGEVNRLAASFTPERSLFTWHRPEENDPKPIDDQPLEEWTVEVSFLLYPSNGDQVLLSKTGNIFSLHPVWIWFRKSGESGRLEVGVVDGSGTPRTVTSQAPLEEGQWYSAVATGSATELVLWLQGPGSSGFVKEGSAALDGAFYNGAGGSGERGTWRLGAASDGWETNQYFAGALDEVRVSDRVLQPEEFLASPATRPDSLRVEARLVPRVDAEGTPVVLALDTNPPADWEDLGLEASTNLRDWAAVAFSVEHPGEVPGRVRLVSTIALKDREASFLRARVDTARVQGEAGNPIFDGADPDVLWWGGRFWVYPTRGAQRFIVFSSEDLVRWRMHGPVLRLADVPWIETEREGRTSHAWAPGVLEKDGRFYLYYSVGPKPSHIGVAVADAPYGPFVDSGQPLLADGGDPGFEAIDAAVFEDPATGKVWLYAGGSAGSTLRLFELNDDLVSFAREISVATPPSFTEGAYMHFRNGTYYLSYSHGSWHDHTYSVHYATASSPAGPWQYRGKILGSDATHKGPGHHSIVRLPGTDEWYIFYHRWNNRPGLGPYSGSRSVAIERLSYQTDGRIAPVTMTDAGPGPTGGIVD